MRQASLAAASHRRYLGTMAREESDREDLLREATALVERVELLVGPDPGVAGDEHLPPPTRIVGGFRANGGLSLFFGADPVYQFNPRRELRRAFSAGRLYRAEGGRLASLVRRRIEDRVELLRHDLSEEEQATFLTRLHDDLSALGRVLRAGDFAIVGQVPESGDVARRIGDWLLEGGNIAVAQAPNA